METMAAMAALVVSRQEGKCGRSVTRHDESGCWREGGGDRLCNHSWSRGAWWVVAMLAIRAGMVLRA